MPFRQGMCNFEVLFSSEKLSKQLSIIKGGAGKGGVTAAKEISLIFTCGVLVLGKIMHAKIGIKGYLLYIKEIDNLLGLLSITF